MAVKSVETQQKPDTTQKRLVPLWFNRIMKFALRSPLHRFVSGNIMLLTFTGRKSGKTYTIPVSYTQQNNHVMMFTNHVWCKNLIENVPVTLHLRGKPINAITILNTDDVEQIAPILAQHLRGKPADARIHKVTFDDSGEPLAHEVRRAAGNIRMVKYKLV